MNDLVEYLKSPYVLGERHASPGELVDQMLSKMKEAADHIEAQNKLIEEMREALELFVSEYTDMVNSGDCGFWDPEKEEKVIKARTECAELPVDGCLSCEMIEAISSLRKVLEILDETWTFTHDQLDAHAERNDE